MKRLHNLSRWLEGHLSGKVALAVSTVVFVLFMATVLPYMARWSLEVAGTGQSPDTSLFYSAPQLYELAEAYGQEGRDHYVLSRFTFDIIWPLVYLAFLTSVLSALLSTLTKNIWRLLNLLPLGGFVFDLLENSGAALVMHRYPQRTPVIEHLAGVFTLLKWVFIGAAFAVLVGGLVLLLMRVLLLMWKIRRSQGDGSAVPNSGKKRKKKVIAVSVIAVVLILAGIFTWYVNDYYTPQTVALEALQSDEKVYVYSLGTMTVIEPAAFSRELGVIFYPGGKVDARAYAPVLREIAEAGYRVVIIHMPFRLAVLSPNRGMEAVEGFSEIDSWVLVGHSLGGAMGSRFAANNPSDIRGLVLWASYPAGDISSADLAVLSVYGTRDGLATVEKVLESRENLPPDARFVPIYGGNHANFGAYGAQAGDLAPYITQQQQHRLVAEATIEFLRRLGQR